MDKQYAIVSLVGSQNICQAIKSSFPPNSLNKPTRGYHSSVTSLTSLLARASHIIASDEDLGDVINEVMTEILTESLHRDICSPFADS